MSIVKKHFLLLCAIFFLFSVSAALNVSLSDHGTNVRNKTTNEQIAVGDLTISVYDAISGGNLIYTETFEEGIINGSWSVMLGENVSNPLSLEYGKRYYKDYSINGTDIDFIDFEGNTAERQFFYSPLGDIADEDVSNSTDLTTTGTGFFGALGSLVSRITNLFVEDIDFSGDINGSGNITTSGNVSASYFFGDGSLLTGITSGRDVSGNYLYNDSTTIFFNETFLNATIDARDSDTTYTNLSEFVDDLGNRGYTDLSNFTDDLGNRGYTHLSNFTDDLLWTIAFNATGDARWLDDTQKNVSGNYLYNDSTTIFFNETFLNATIDARASGSGDNASWNESHADSKYLQSETDPFWSANFTLYNDTWSQDTTYANLSELFDDLGNRGYTSLSNFTDNLGDRGYTHLGNFTDNLGNRGYTSLSNFTDDLGSRGYTHLTNFTDDLGNRGYTHLTNFTDDLLWTASFNATGDTRWLDDTDTQKTTSGNYLYNDSTTIFFNETVLNATIDARDSDTTYANLSEFVDDLGNRGYTHLSNFTDNLDYSDKTVNRSAYWDGLDSPADILISQLQNDLNFINETYANATYLRKDGDNGTGQYNFDGGWQSGGTTIDGGNVYAQALYVYDVNSLSVSNLDVNGSLFPDMHNTFDIGNATLQWNDLHLGGNIVMNGTIDTGQGAYELYGLERDLLTGGAISIVGGGDNVLYGADSDITISHADTSSQANSSNSNGTVIQDILLDDYGHLISLGTVDLDSRYLSNAGDTATGNYTFDTDTLHIDSSADRVGIGVASPRAKLEVGGESDARNLLINGGFEINSRDYGMIFKTLLTNNKRTQYIFYDSSDVQTGKFGVDVLGTNDDDFQIVAGSGTVPQFHLEADGNVGINTTTPQNTLNVVGDGNFTGNVTAAYFIGDGSQLTGISSGDNASWNESHADSKYLQSETDPLWSANFTLYNDTWSQDTTYANLSELFDDLGNRGYTSLSNFTDDLLWTASFNATGDSRWLDDTQKNVSGNYLYNDSTTIFFNESVLNATIDARASGSGDNASWNESYADTLYLSNTGDTATGNYTFDTDTLFIDSSADRIGVGTTTPNAALHAVGSVGSVSTLDDNVATFQNTDGQAAISINSASSSDHAVLLGALGGDIVGSILFTANSGDLGFWTNDDQGGNTWRERMRILNLNGNVGIGLTNPQEALHVFRNNNVAEGIRVANTNTGVAASTIITLENDAATDAAGLYLNSIANTARAGAGSFNLGTVANYPVGIITNNAVRMTLDNAGRVGINTTTPQNTLHVIGDGNFTENVTAAYFIGDGSQLTGIGSGDNASWNESYADTLYLSNTGDTATGNYTFDTDTLHIDSSADRVGIGTTAPETTLHTITTNKLGTFFTGSVAGEGLRVDQSNYGNGNYVSFIEGSYDDGQTAPHTRIGARYTGSGSYLAFGTSNSYNSGITNQALTIDYDGRVGIGATSPDSLLEVEGDIRIGGGTQDYVFSKRADILLTLQSQTSGTAAQVEYYTKDGDGTDQVGFAVFAKGVPSNIATFEQFRFYYDDTTASYIVGTNKGGDGSDRPIRIGNGLTPTDLFIQATTGEIGINTTTPQNTLHVIGDGNFTENVTAAYFIGDGSQLTGIGSGDNASWNESYADTLYLSNAGDTATGNYTFDTDTLHIDSSQNRVGIGTTSPDSLLHLAGPSGVSTLTMETPGNTKYRMGTASGIADWGATSLNAYYNSGWYLDSTNLDGWFFKLDTRSQGAAEGNGLWLYRIPNGANPHVDEYPVFGVTNGYGYFRDDVGIGTTTPANKLDVEGGAVVGAGYSGSTVAPTNGLLVEGDVGIGTSSPKNTLNVVGTSNFTGDFRVNEKTLYADESDGRVGINTASPASLLDIYVSSNRLVRAYSSAADFYVLSDNGAGSDVVEVRGLGAANVLNVVAGSNTEFIVKSTGNVGVGTDTPQNDLNVVGDFNVTGEPIFEALNGSYTNGEAYVCVYDNGTIFAKDSACS